MSEYIYVNDNQLEKKLEDYPTSEVVSEQINQAKNELNANIDNALSGGVDGEINLANYYTKEEVDKAIDEQDFVINITGMVDETHVTLDRTFEEIQTAYSEGKNLYMLGTLDGDNYGIASLAVVSTSSFVFQSNFANEVYLFSVTNGNVAEFVKNVFIDDNHLLDYYNTRQIDQKLEAVTAATDAAIQNAIGDVLGGAS